MLTVVLVVLVTVDLGGVFVRMLLALCAVPTGRLARVRSFSIGVVFASGVSISSSLRSRVLL